MSEKTENGKITLDIRPGPLTPEQQRSWNLFWQKLIADSKTKEKDTDERKN